MFCFVVIGAVYYIYIKQILLIYPPIAAAAWGYMSAAVMMGITAMFYNRHYQEHWNLPSEAVGPLIYWILVCSVGGYCSITWAAKYLPSTQVSIYDRFYLDFNVGFRRWQHLRVFSHRSDRYWVSRFWENRCPFGTSELLESSSDSSWLIESQNRYWRSQNQLPFPRLKCTKHQCFSRTQHQSNNVQPKNYKRILVPLRTSNFVWS